MLLVRREGARFAARIISWAIPCIGARDAAQSQRLAQAFQRRDIGQVKSLRRDGAPDASCWVEGEGWWLSTEAGERDARLLDCAEPRPCCIVGAVMIVE